MRLLSLVLLAACSSQGGDLDAPLRPSLTMLRVGEVEVEAPPPIPEDRYLPGIVLNSEDVVYAGDGEEGSGQAPPPGPQTDTSSMPELGRPAALDKHVSSYAYGIATGNLFDGKSDENKLNADDVQQGAIGDCYVVAALSSALHADASGALRAGMIRAETGEDGLVRNFAVRLYDAWGDPQDVKVDAALVRRSGRPLYARSADSDKSGEEWGVSLVEKAYAHWHGSYEKIGNGGWAGDVLQALTGATATYREVGKLTDSSLLKTVGDALRDGRPVVAGTFGEDDGVDYTGTGVYAFHAYSVLGIDTTVTPPTLKLRNPWGSSEPAGNGADDGIFNLDLPTFRKLYQGLTYGGTTRADVTAPGAVKDLAAAEVVGDAVVLTFTSSGDDGTEGLAARYELRAFSSAPTAGNFFQGEPITLAATPQTPGEAERITIRLPALTQGETRFLALRVEDEVGNLSAMSNVISVAGNEDEVPPQPPGLYSFEGGDELWTATGLWHLSSKRSASPIFSYWFGDEMFGSYGTGSAVSGELRSPRIDLSSMSYAYLLWEQVVDIDSDELAVVEVSTESGGYSDWMSVWSADGSSTDFEMGEIDLEMFVGEIVQLRFRFDSHDAHRAGRTGWFVDDVWVLAE